jgi:hypothetical protein
MAARMKTITELSGTLIRKAAAAIAEAKRSLPKEASPAAAETAPAPVAEAPAADASAPAPAPSPEAPTADAAATGADAGGGETATATAPAAPAAAPAGRRTSAPVEEVETDAAKAAFDAAVAEATGLSGDRLARLRDAVKAAGRQVEDVRLVRVFGAEEPVTGAKTLNGFQYLVDLAPTSMRQDFGSPKKDRFGGRGGRGGGGGGGGKGAPASGGFSMDAMKEDRKGQRGCPGGRGGRRGGGPKR